MSTVCRSIKSTYHVSFCIAPVLPTTILKEILTNEKIKIVPSRLPVQRVLGFRLPREEPSIQDEWDLRPVTHQQSWLASLCLQAQP